MDTLDAIDKRHSYRGPYENTRVPRRDLRRIVQSGIRAPSGVNAQTTTFLIVDDSDMLDRLRALELPNEAMRQAKAIIFCLVDRNPQPVYKDLVFQVEDCSAAVENMLLTITALGYASVWVDGWLLFDNNAEKVGRALDLPKNKVVKVMLPIGVPVKKVKQRKKKPFRERAWFNEYGGPPSGTDK